jgi:hypothetical protein
MSSSAGIQRGLSGFAQDAQAVAQSGTTSASSDALPDALVVAQQWRLAVKASARMLATAIRRWER